MQIGTAAIQLLKTNVSVKNGASLLGQFVDACDMPHWGEGKCFPDPISKTSEIGEMLCKHVLVQQVAAFDLFSRDVVSDFAKFSQWARDNCPKLKHKHAYAVLSPQHKWCVSPCCNELVDKLGDLKVRLDEIQSYIQWQPSDKLKSIIPLFHLARKFRNRVVHSDGMIGADLEEYARSKEVEKAFESFVKNYTKSSPPLLPKLKKGDVLSLSPVNAIFFGAVLYEVAKEINEFVCSKMENTDFVVMAFHYSCLVETHPFRTIAHKSAGARIKHFLASRYIYREASKIKEVVSFLKPQVTANNSSTSLWSVAVTQHNLLTS